MDNSKTIALMKATLLSAVYPIGAIYMSTNSTNPGQIFGGFCPKTLIPLYKFSTFA